LSIWLIAVAAAAGGFLGDTGSMGLVAPPVPGPRGGCFAAQRPRPAHLGWEALERHGATIIVVARFVPGGRTATLSPPEPCGWLGRGLPLPTRLARPCGQRMRPGWAISVARCSSGARCMPSCSVWAWRCWSPSWWRRRGGSGGGVPGLAIGARLEGGRSDEGQSWDGHKKILERDSNQTPWSKMPSRSRRCRTWRG
jgi:hypothetical protein